MSMTIENKKYTLKSSDNESFEVDEPVAMMCQTIKHIVEDGCSDNGIPLPNVSATILSKVIEYCKKHAAVESPPPNADASSSVTVKDDLKDWDKDFLNVDQTTLFDIILAANYLDIRGLLDLACQAVADMIKGKMPEDIRQMFNIKNDFTSEEEEAVRKENAWAFE